MKMNMVEKIVIFVVFFLFLWLGTKELLKVGNISSPPADSVDASIYWERAQEVVKNGGFQEVGLKAGLIYFEAVFLFTPTLTQ